MKFNRFSVYLIVVMICMFLFSCDIVPSNDNIHVKENDVSLNDIDKDTPYANAIIETHMLSIYSYEDYQDFINNTDLPENFVYFDYLSQFGKFKGVVILEPYDSMQYERYMYTFDTGMCLYIDHNRTVDDKIKENLALNMKFITDVNKSDLRTIKASQKSFYAEDDFVYNYINSTLISTSWEIDGILYTLSDSDNFQSTSLTDDIAVSKLLNAETAASVVEAMVTKIHSVAASAYYASNDCENKDGVETYLVVTQ